MSSALQSTKTPHRRRRKANAVDKENRGLAANYLLTVNDGEVSFEKVRDATDPKQDDSSTYDLGQTLQNFRDAVSKAPEAMVFFQERSNLDENVIRSSLSPQSSVGLWHVQNHSAELLSLSRKLIKQTTQEETIDGNNLLLIAVHCLRAVIALQDRDSTQESCIRLLYHLLTATTTPEKDPMTVIAGFEALHFVLHNYSCLTGDGRVVHFLAGSLSSWQGAVVPCFADDKTARGTMTLRQVVTIAIKSCLACVSSVNQLWCLDASTPSGLGEPRRDETLTIIVSLKSILLGKQPTNDPLYFMQLLFQSCYYPWLSFVADCQDMECTKDLTAHCKTAHKVIWDAAIKLKDKPAIFDTRPTLEDYCLQLRGIAIEMLLPEAKSIEGMKFIRDSLWESALSYASKACTVNAQQVGSFPVAADSALATFHRSVGPKLNRYRMTQSCPMPYVEYCVQRFLHCGISPKLHTCCNPQCWKLDFRNENDAGSLILMLTMIGIRANHMSNDTVDTHLFSECCDGNLLDTDTQANDLEQILSNFLSALLPKRNALSTQTQYRYFQLFSTLAFHRSLFQTLRNDTQAFNVTALEILARVLIHCIGPLSLIVAKSCKDPTKNLAIFESALECYIRPLAAFERLRAMHHGDHALKYEMLANQTIFEIYQVFQAQDPVPTKLIEKCAKSISLVARQRSDANCTMASIYPALVSIPLYSHLAVHCGSQGESTYQIPARLAHLANALQSAGLLSHAVVVFAVLLAHELPNCYSGEVLEWEEIDLQRFLVSRCKNIFIPDTSTFLPTTLARSSIRRLISIISDIRSHQEQAEPGEQLEGAWETFLAALQINNSFWEAIEKKQEKLLISTVLPRLLTLEQPRKETSVRIFLLLVDVIAELGASLQGSSQLTDTSWQMQDCHAIISHLQRAPITIEMASPPVHHALVIVVAATTFLDNKAVEYSKAAALENASPQKAEHPTFPFFMKLARDALTHLKSTANIENASSVQSEFLCATIQHFCWQLEADQGCEATSVVFQQCQQAMDTFVQSVPTSSQDTVVEFWSNAFIWTLSLFQNQLESMGDSTRSVIVMEWILELLNEDDLDKSTWFRSMAISAFLTSPLCKGDLNALVIPETGTVSRCTSMQWFAKKELHLSSLRALITFGNDEPEFSLMERAQSIQEEIQSAEGTVKPTLLLWWLYSGVELIFAELAASSGSFTEALHHIQESCRLSLSVISSTRGSAQPDVSLSTWENVVRCTLASRATRRYIELLGLRSKIYARTGDHRKAVAYLTNLSDYLGVDLKRVDKECGPNVEEMLPSDSGLSARLFRRLSFDILCSAGAQDLVLQGLEQTGDRWLKSAWTESADDSLKLQVILDVLSVGDLVYGESVNSSLHDSFSSFYTEALDYYHKIVSNQLFETYRRLTNDRPISIGAKVIIREIRCICHLASQLDSETLSRVRELCEKVKANPAAETVDRVWAYYYEASLEIAALRQSGALGLIWSQDQRGISDAENQNLQNTRHLLSTAAAIHGIGSDILSRLILRNLALVTGPENGCTNSSSAGALVLRSIGQSLRQLMVRSLQKGHSDLSDLFNQSDFTETGSGILDQLAQLSPSNWKFVAATLCPSGDLLITSIEKDSAGKMFMDTILEEPKNGESVYEDVMVPLDVIINESQNQLFGMDPSTISEQYVKEANKRAWWETRYKLDERLRILLERVENNYFHSVHLRKDSNDCIFADATPLPIGNLASKFEAAAVNSVQTPQRETDESLKKLTVPKLKDKLRSEYGFSDASLRKMKKQELIDLILSQSDARHEANEENPKEGCLFLILDENLHRFPFEGIPSLVGQCVCRVPSLAFVLATLLEKGIQSPGETPMLDPCHASYVLDPESNLASSRARLKPVLDNIASEHDWEWDGVVGEIPPVSFMEQGLCRRDGLFLYFGHGGGQTCYSRKQVENLISRRDGHEERACSATVVLMGCSSGRLVSVNRKHSQSLQQVPLYYEPEGIALSYLCAGAPCVVGNLWDVTDHDIDRFSTALLQQFLQSDRTSNGESLASCVAKSREACKLRFIVGCAPVCYGVPVHLLN